LTPRSPPLRVMPVELSLVFLPPSFSSVFDVPSEAPSGPSVPLRVVDVPVVLPSVVVDSEEVWLDEYWPFERSTARLVESLDVCDVLPNDVVVDRASVCDAPVKPTLVVD